MRVVLRTPLRVLLWLLGGLVLLVLAAAAWFVQELRGHPHVAAPAADGSILSFAAPAPHSRPAPARPDYPANLDPATLAQPLPAARPWVRWWWPGGDISAQAACEQLARLQAAGFGGVEIQAFNAGLRAIDDAQTQARINSFDGEGWQAALDEVMRCARELEVLVYLNHLSGWPAGGPQVALEDGLWTLRYAEARVSGGADLEVTLPLPRPGVNDYLMALAEFFIDMELSGFALQQRRLAVLLAARVSGGERSANPLDATDTLALDPASVQVLTERVENGVLRWRAPPGDWVLIAAYLMPSAEAPTLVAARQPGFVIDHLDEARVRAHYDYAYGERSGLAPHYGRPLAGFFNDSLEFKLDRLASRDMLEAFALRRGYELAPHLPAVFVDTRDNFFIRDVGRTRAAPAFSLDERDARVRHDYQQTLSDLVIERFVETSADWAARRGLLSRGQTYGLDMDTIRALGANHIPETEHLWGNSSELPMKLAGAAGLLYGRPLVSAESFVWARRAYAVTPRHIKAGADLLFLSGVNQVIYHGVPYTGQSAAYADTFGWLGWYPFLGPGNPSGFAGNYGPSTPMWRALPQLNQYLWRSQNILQAGQPTADLLVYYPFLGFPKSIEDSPLAAQSLLFAGLFPQDPPVAREGESGMPLARFLPREKDPRVAWLERLLPTLRALDARGVTWTWVNDHALQTGRGGGRPLLVADVESMPPATVQALAELAAESAPLYFLGELPRRQLGLHDHESGDARVARGIRALADGRRVDDARQLLAQLQPALAVSGSAELRRVSRRFEDGDVAHLLVNRSLEETAGVLTPANPDAGRSAWWFDAASGAAWPASERAAGGYDLALGALESRFLLFTDKPLQVGAMPLATLRQHARTRIALDPAWSVSVAGQPQGAAGELPLLRELPYQEGGPTQLAYATTFDDPRVTPGERVLLDLGAVAGIAQLELNGQSFDARVFDPFLFDVTAALRAGDNQLRLVITPPLRNSLVNSPDARHAELQQYRDELGRVGLAGPVSLLLLPSAADQP